MIAFLDTEVSGWSKEKNALCEIGLIITTPELEIVYEWQTYIKPYMRADGLELCSYKPDAMAVNGITMEQLEGGMDIQYALRSLLYGIYFNDVKTIVCHNLPFDMGWIDFLNVIHLNHRIKGIAYRDTLELCRKRFPNQCNKLESVCDRLGIKQGGHNALGDAMACMEVYKLLKCKV